MRVRLAPLALLAAIGLAACSELPTDPGSPPDASLNRQSAPGQQRLAGLDAEFERIARDAPGFGGMFYDADGLLHVYVTPTARTAAGQAAILNRINASLRAQDRPMVTAAGTRLLEASRDYVELGALRNRLHPVLGEPGVVFTDIDETRNQLRIGVLEGTSLEGIQSVLTRLDVPLDAVSIDVTEPIVPVTTLRDAHDPVAGGLQIWRFIPPGLASICTLGFNLRYDMPHGSDHYFMTNSHCTEARGEVTGTEFRQGVLSLATRIVAVEVEDPPFFTCQYVGFRCRWSDAAIAKYHPDVPVRLGMIYRTAAVGTTSAATLDLDDEGRYFTIAGERPFPVVGEVLDKVGRTTGWTRGPVVGTCIDAGVSGSDPPIAMLCQDFVEAAVGAGDSGSPVFRQIGIDKPVWLQGILWGSGGNFYVLSAVENIRLDLGQFRVR